MTPHKHQLRLLRSGIYKGASLLRMALLATGLFLLLCLPQVSLAGPGGGIEESPIITRLAGSTVISPSSPLVVGGAITSVCPTITYEKSHSIKNIISLSLYETSSEYVPANFTASVQLKIKYGHSSGSVDSIEQTLQVTYDKSAGAKYNARNYFSFENAEYVKVTVLAITAPTVSGFDTKKALIVENEMRVTRFYDLSTTPADLVPPSFSITTPATGIVPDALTVNWVWKPEAANTHTQLEWTWVEDELITDYYTAGSLDYDLLFQHNASRVDLAQSQLSYDVPLLYGGTGHVYFHIRPVVISATGNRQDGPWCTAISEVFTGHNDSLNWQSTTSFAEEGKRKSVIQYYDGSLRLRQTVTKDNSTNTTVTAETFYDGEGRPAIQILPVPGINNIISYTKNLNLFNGQSANQDPAIFFDLQPIATPNSFTPPLDTMSGASLYYSSFNTEKTTAPNNNIPDAEGYPYSVTRYTPDGTGRILSQSGVGAAMQMGKGHEIKYYYGTPSQDELDGLFGTEAGTNTHYFKNMVKDANGQMSVSYVDMHGRTIATALAGESPANLEKLPLDETNYPHQLKRPMTQDLANGSNVIKNNSIESINTLLVPTRTEYSFHYELSPQVLQLSLYTGADVCYDCMYNLEISITDESGDAAPIVKKFNNINMDPDDDCETSPSDFKNDTTHAVSNSVNFTYTLDPGSYIVRKTLTVDEASLQRNRDLYLSKAMHASEQTLIDSIAAVLETLSGCSTPPAAVTCQSCADSLGTFSDYRTKFLATIGNPDPVAALLDSSIRTAYLSAQLRCSRLCDTVSTALADLRNGMLADMMPYTGQYAGTEAPSPTDGTTMYDEYNIFSTTGSGVRPFYKNPWNSSKTLDYFYNADRIKDPVIHPDGTRTQLSTTIPDDFASLFNDAWANALLPHHPEYDRLVFAETNLSASYNWITGFTNTSTYAAAFTKGYLFTNGSDMTDPFYVTSASDKTLMAGWINSNFQGGLSMWQIAYGNVKCTNPDPAISGPCFSTAPHYPPFTGLTTDELDRVWNNFKAIYNTRRNNQVNAYIAAGSPLANAATLVDEKYILRFPESDQQMADQLGDQWSWYPATPGGPPDLSHMGDTTAAQVNSHRCSNYIEQWKRDILQCASIASRMDKDSIINLIVTGMETVCQKGTDAANIYGASNVNPATPDDGSPRSFEDVIARVFLQFGISKDTLCNPYVVKFPGPYGSTNNFAKEMILVVDSCNCSQFAQMKSEALGAGNNPAILSSLNAYLKNKYKDTLTQVLYDAMALNCAHLRVTTCRDTITYTPWDCNSEETVGPDCTIQGGSGHETLVPDSCYLQCLQRICTTTNSAFTLDTPQPYPAFLKCGFVYCNNCLTCADLSQLAQEFRDSIPSPYNAGPIFTDTLLTPNNIRDNVLFAQFVNYRRGFQYTWIDYAQAAAAAGCTLIDSAGHVVSNGSPTTLVINSRSGNLPLSYVARTAIEFLPGFTNGTADYFEAYLDSMAMSDSAELVCAPLQALSDTTGLVSHESPCAAVQNMAVYIGHQLFEAQQQQLLAEFEAQYRARCLAMKDSFTVSDTMREYHYTLYYYDMAGNLLKTVPPAGVRPDYSETFLEAVRVARIAGTVEVPSHVLITDYRYNSLNQVMAQHSPDADTSHFWYDRLGRLAVSQNAQQALDDKYSYTLYDDLGRITEVGQKPQTEKMEQLISQDTTALKDWILTDGGTREQITTTVYDQLYLEDLFPNGGLEGKLGQRNLRNRVSYSATKSLSTDADQFTATFYTYDIHGNVDTLLQDYKGIVETGTSDRYKKIAYDYDLISGKVNKVNYQAGHADAFYHRYRYDAENRLTAAETSRDQLVWETDASYQYYKYGPLSRTVLGQLQVQGMDYAYTLQGWLKGVNGTTVGDGTYDMGQDGVAAGNNAVVARDVLGFALHYYDETQGEDSWEDYKSIHGTATFARPVAGNHLVSLYNGNIGAMTVNNAGLLNGSGSTTNALPLFYNYRYDQLNRITRMQTYSGLSSSNAWTPVEIQDYKEKISYDPNGNILKYNRHGSPAISGKDLEMDSLTYHYYSNTNRLKWVDDSVGVSTDYTDDLEQQSSSSNYTYDAIGNLKTDISEGITDDIQWTVYGKIASIIKSGHTILYTYDATGNRISKTADNKTTLYVRDASGNVMSVYESPEGESELAQKEAHLYGNSRLGMTTALTVAPDEVEISEDFMPGKLSTFTRGEKLFELSNHLGNVLATVNDKKLAVDAALDGTIDYYTADVMTAQDYYPFGMGMPGRKYAADDSYRYGFNGKENDNEVKGEGNQQDYGMRVYDLRLCRFLSVDPVNKQYPWLTPYQFASNRPIDGIDLDGKEWSVSRNGNTVAFTLKIQVYNESKTISNPRQLQRLLSGLETSIEARYTKSFLNADGTSINYTTDIQFDINPAITKADSKFKLVLRDIEPKIVDEVSNTYTYAGGSTIVAKAGNNATQENELFGTLSVKNANAAGDAENVQNNTLTRNISHEIGHSGGLPHVWQLSSPADINQTIIGAAIGTAIAGAQMSGASKKELKNLKKSLTNYFTKKLKSNLMNSSEQTQHPSLRTSDPNSTELTKGQFELIERTVTDQQPKPEKKQQ